jgi:hypothetical protein
MVEARYSVGRSMLFLVIGLVAFGSDLALYLFGPRYFPAVFFIALLLIGAGLRVLDRRVKLRISSEGGFYAPWGAHSLPWGEFDGFTVFQHRGFRFVEARPRYPDLFRTRLSAFQRLSAWLNRRFGRPAFFINPNQLDATPEQIVSAINGHQQVTGPDDPLQKSR